MGFESNNIDQGNLLLLQKKLNALNKKVDAIESGGGGGGGGGDIPIATTTTVGGIKVGRNLLVYGDGTLTVDTASSAQSDNTRPITSAAVYTEIGNINALLATI